MAKKDLLSVTKVFTWLKIIKKRLAAKLLEWAYTAKQNVEIRLFGYFPISKSGHSGFRLHKLKKIRKKSSLCKHWPGQS